MQDSLDVRIDFGDLDKIIWHTEGLVRNQSKWLNSKDLDIDFKANCKVLEGEAKDIQNISSFVALLYEVSILFAGMLLYS